MTSPECLDPCKFKGRFQPDATYYNQCLEARHNPSMGNNTCCGEPVQLSQTEPEIKCHAERDCLFNNQEICPCEEGSAATNKIMTDVTEPPITEQSPLLSDTLNKNDYLKPVSEYKRADESENPPCYMPQPMDNEVVAKDERQMGPIGAWATGKVDWSPLAGLTGTRPVVDRYSITRFSPNEWRQRNKDILNETFDIFELRKKNETHCKNTITKTYATVDKMQKDNTKRLRERGYEVYKWKETLERSIRAMVDEISELEEQALRMKKAEVVLKHADAIAGECIERRCCRPDTELVRDKPEEELINELALISEIRLLYNKILADAAQQQLENRAGRFRLEYDWSDKEQASLIYNTNIALNNRSTTIMFRPGATRYSEEQSSEEYWEHFTKETLDAVEKCRQKSVTLRKTLDASLLNAARDLRNQADIVEKAFTIRINCVQESLSRFENELKDCLRHLADTEIRIEKLNKAIRGLDYAMKVVQTRLDNLLERPHVENCRDKSQTGLVNEVKAIQDEITNLLGILNRTEVLKNSLMKTRGDLETEIMMKRRTLMVDRERCMLLRVQFPSVSALSGYV